jgi:hypothetical protein
VSHPSFFERTGVTTVRGISAEWGSWPGETSLHWIEDRQSVQVMSQDLNVAELAEVANGLTTAH